jgi:rhomboid family GlyGly-CTERM serine protease
VAGRLRLNAGRLRQPGTAWVALAGLAAGASLAVAGLPEAWQQALHWRADRAWAAWRWLTAALVHLHAAHLGANLAGAAAVAVFGWAARLPAGAALAWAAAWPLTHATLIVHPGLPAYAGLSGVLHAGVAVAAVWLLICGPARRARWVALAVLGGLSLKIALEQPWGPALQPLPGWDFALAPVAHAAGAVVGAACGAVGAAVSRRRSRPVAPPPTIGA